MNEEILQTILNDPKYLNTIEQYIEDIVDIFSKENKIISLRSFEEYQKFLEHLQRDVSLEKADYKFWTYSSPFNILNEKEINFLEREILKEKEQVEYKDIKNILENRLQKDLKLTVKSNLKNLKTNQIIVETIYFKDKGTYEKLDYLEMIKDEKVYLVLTNFKEAGIDVDRFKKLSGSYKIKELLEMDAEQAGKIIASMDVKSKNAVRDYIQDYIKLKIIEKYTDFVSTTALNNAMNSVNTIISVFSANQTFKKEKDSNKTLDDVINNIIQNVFEKTVEKEKEKIITEKFKNTDVVHFLNEYFIADESKQKEYKSNLYNVIDMLSVNSSNSYFAQHINREQILDSLLKIKHPEDVMVGVTIGQYFRKQIQQEVEQIREKFLERDQKKEKNEDVFNDIKKFLKDERQKENVLKDFVFDSFQEYLRKKKEQEEKEDLYLDIEDKKELTKKVGDSILIKKGGLAI